MLAHCLNLLYCLCYAMPDWTLESNLCLGLIARSVQVLRYDQYTDYSSANAINKKTGCDSPTWKGKDYVCGGGGGGGGGGGFGRFRRPENNVCWLAPSINFQKKGGGGHLFGVCAVKQVDMVNGIKGTCSFVRDMWGDLYFVQDKWYKLTLG